MIYTAQETQFKDTWQFSNKAMHTRFDLWIYEPNASYAEKAAFGTFEILFALEEKLSRFIPNSEIARINQLDGDTEIRLSPDTYDCLEIAVMLYEKTGGKFDPNYLSGDNGFGMIKLNPDHLSMITPPQGLTLDLGGIGKGFAVDRMAAELLEWDIPAFLISGGKSSVRAGAAPKDTNGWRLSLWPPNVQDEPLTEFIIKHQSLGASGLDKGPHIIDPNKVGVISGRAVWVAAFSAAVADGLSTAFMMMALHDIENVALDFNSSAAIWENESLKVIGENLFNINYLNRKKYE